MKTVTIEDKKRIEEIIAACDVCYVGMVDKEGNPYVIPMNFGYKDEILYLHSGQTGSSIEMLSRHNQVCITFCTRQELAYQNVQVACSYRMKGSSVICRGKVSFPEDMQEKREALDILMKQYTDRTFTYSDPAVRNVKVWKIPIDSMTVKEYGVPYYE